MQMKCYNNRKQKKTHLKQFTIRDISIVIHVVNAEGKSQFRQFVTFHAELGYSLNELLKVNFTVAVFIENVDDPLDQRVLLQFWQWHKLIHTQGARIIQIQFTETFPQSTDLISVDWN